MMELKPVWLMQPIPYMGETLEGDWIVEPKVDGWRLQILKANGKIQFWGRRLEKNPNWTDKLSYLSDFLRHIPDNTILDAELYSEKGRRFIPSLFKKNPDVRPVIMVFDVLYLNGEKVFMLPLKDRKLFLENLNLKEPFYLMPYKKLVNDVKTHLLEEKKKGHEGIVLKMLYSPYEIGKDGPIATIFWRKVK
jgi:ATP-dependent DNA ligase